jgi:hypothetical protein
MTPWQIAAGGHRPNVPRHRNARPYGPGISSSLSSKPTVIFTTAYKKYAWNGYNLNVLDFLLSNRLRLIPKSSEQSILNIIT